VEAQQEQAQTLGAIATIISAFVVFVFGGGAVLVSWVAAQRAAESMPIESMAPVQEEAPQATEVVETLAEPVPQPVEPTEQPTVKRNDAPAPVPVRRRRPVRTVEAEEPSVVVPPVVVPVLAPTEPAENPDGRGTVIIIGDAERVRLIGGRGTFGAGALPSGTYTIQATFEGDEPRMAGTVAIGDGERVRIVCISDQRQCSRR